MGLLALHRAGAEACELVAQTAVADEAVLVAALAETRQLVAPQAVTTISKSVESASYAGLLLRDVLDDAEGAALSLYRSCLARNVSPPIAAQRVGMVFGVPARELGRYQQLASDPKSNPVAVADAADRVLFGFVAKMVKEEYTPAKELVSKESERVRERTGVTPDDPATEHYDARDERGQFARTAQGAQAPERAVGSRARMGRTVGPDLSGRAPSRALRASRVERAQRVSQSAATAPKSKATSRAKVSSRSAAAPVRSAAQAERSRTRLSAQARAMQAIVHDTLPEPDPKPMGLGDVPDVLSKRKDPNAHLHGAMGHSLGFALPSDRWSELARAMGEGDLPTSRLLRAGALQEFAGRPEQFHDVDDSGSLVLNEDHQAQVAGVASVAHSSPDRQGQEDLYVKRLDKALFAGMNADAQERQLDAEKRDLLMEWEAVHGRPAPRMREMGYVQAVPDYDDPDSWVLVYTPPPEGVAIGKRPMPGVTEVLIEPSDARGHDQGMGRHSDYEIDQNQVLEVFDRATFFDTALGVMRSRVTLVESDEAAMERAIKRKGVGKALTREQFRENEREGDIVRDEDTGRFTSRQRMGRQSMSRQGSSLRTTRGARTVRSVSTAAPLRSQARAQSSAGGASTARLSSQAASRAAVRTSADLNLKAHARARSEAEELPVTPSDDSRLLELPDGFEYDLVDDAMMRVMAADDRQGFLESVDKPWSLGWRAAASLYEHGTAFDEGGDETLSAVFSSEVDAHNSRAVDETPAEQFIYARTVNTAEDLEAVKKVVIQLMAAKPDVSVLTAHISTRRDGGYRWEIYANPEPLPGQHVVRWESGRAGRMASVTLVKEGEYRTQNHRSVSSWVEMADEIAQLGGPTTVWLADPKVTVWRAETR